MPPSRHRHLLSTLLFLFPVMTTLANNISSAEFGKMPDGTISTLYTLTNAHGMVVKITDYGGIITEIHTPDRDGKMNDVVLGFDTLAGYTAGHPYFGAIIGRYGNRINEGKFELDGESYQLPINNGPNSLHGGIQGFDKVVWQAKEIKGRDYVGLQLNYTSPDGEEGFPGKLDVIVTYKLTNDNAIEIDYQAVTDKPTICNLTNHSYFNLSGHDSGDILDHEVMIEADYFTPVNNTLIPTGEIITVKGTPFDFTEAKPIGARIEENDEQLKIGSGYDHNFVLNKNPGEWALAARVVDPKSGRSLEVWTEEPGVQLYVGNFLDGTKIGKNKSVYHHRNGFCLETQRFPDSPNHPHFPTTRLNPGETYKTKTVYKFSTQ